jgi:molybdopterin/thiamine biosynthesis adenylyltransferase/rhodanese-related sulfurtransferase
MQTLELQQRYKTQLLLPNFGVSAQEKLSKAAVLVIGAGGLGCPCLQYLIAAGVGKVGICDGDKVEISNLHRQILFNTNDIGSMKVDVAKMKLQTVYPLIDIKTYDYFLDNSSAIHLFANYDIIIDCTDDIEVRYLINDACVLLNKPFVFGAVYQYEGQVAVLNTDEKKINLRDLFDEINSEDLLTCNNSGALGAITGLIGTMQALETIKYIAALEGNLKNELLICNFLNYHHYKIALTSSVKKTQVPQTINDFMHKKYKLNCLNEYNINTDLNQEAFLKKIKEGNVQVIDVRNENEQPKINYFTYDNIPLNELILHPEKVSKEKTILLFCHAGIRSRIALDFLKDEQQYIKVYHLKGGIIKWKDNETSNEKSI